VIVVVFVGDGEDVMVSDREEVRVLEGVKEGEAVNVKEGVRVRDSVEDFDGVAENEDVREPECVDEGVGDREPDGVLVVVGVGEDDAVANMVFDTVMDGVGVCVIVWVGDVDLVGVAVGVVLRVEVCDGVRVDLVIVPEGVNDVLRVADEDVKHEGVLEDVPD
jgi:hypothetical protein